MRTLVIGDIHGGLRALIQVMERASVATADRLIFLGDYVDGWSEAVETVNYLIKLRKSHSCVLLRGNHDTLCHDWLLEGKDNPLWFQHGGLATLKSYEASSKTTHLRHLEFYESLDNYYLDNSSRLFVHAGFTNLRGVEHEYFPTPFYWDRTLWELALSLDPNLRPESANYPQRLSHYKEIYIGHTPVTRMGETKPVNATNVWNIDTGAAFKGRLTVMDIDTKEYWQSEPVFTLYPGESGRN